MMMEILISMCVFVSLLYGISRNFSLETLLQDPYLVERYANCSVGIFRLAPQDYHRYHIPVDGTIGKSVLIEVHCSSKLQLP